MKKILLGLVFLSIFIFPILAIADVWVDGYYRSSGTYVKGHYRSDPDGIKTNNWSYPGNTNPYTGKTAGGSVDSYLNNSYTPSFNSYYSAPSISTCPANSYSSGSSCKCNYGYVSSGGKCVSGYSYCSSELGIMSTYDSLSNTCKCMSGYEVGSLGFCTYKSNYSSYTPSYYSSYSSGSSLSCPAHSIESATDPNSCSCEAGYKTNSSKNKCVKITKKDNDKICKAEYGSKSEWSGQYGTNESPTCVCKKDYGWNSSQTSCVKLK